MDSYTKLLETQRALTQIAETIREAYIPLMNSLDIPKISLAESLAKSAQATLPKIQLIDYREGLLASTKALEEAMFQAQAIQDQQIQNLKHIISSIRFTELESLDCLADTLRQFAHVLEEAALYDDSFYLDEAEDEEDYIDEETAEYLATIVSQVQSVIEPERAVPFKRLRNWIKSLSIEAKIALLSLLVQIIFGFAEQLPDPQITEQNNLIAEQNQILTGIWQEMQEYNDTLAPAPTPECTPTPTEQWLST